MKINSALLLFAGMALFGAGSAVITVMMGAHATPNLPFIAAALYVSGLGSFVAGVVTTLRFERAPRA